MSLHVLPTNEMKSNLAAHIRDVTADPRRRVFVGAHRRAEAVLLSTHSELPETQLHTLAVLAGRALGYELTELPHADTRQSELGEYRQILATLAERQRREDCQNIAAEAAIVIVRTTDTAVPAAVREIGRRVGDAVEPYLSWQDLAPDVERLVGQRSGRGGRGNVSTASVSAVHIHHWTFADRKVDPNQRRSWRHRCQTSRTYSALTTTTPKEEAMSDMTHEAVAAAWEQTGKNQQFQEPDALTRAIEAEAERLDGQIGDLFLELRDQGIAQFRQDNQGHHPPFRRRCRSATGHGPKPRR